MDLVSKKREFSGKSQPPVFSNKQLNKMRHVSYGKINTGLMNFETDRSHFLEGTRCLFSLLKNERHLSAAQKENFTFSENHFNNSIIMLFIL